MWAMLDAEKCERIEEEINDALALCDNAVMTLSSEFPIDSGVRTQWRPNGGDFSSGEWVGDRGSHSGNSMPLATLWFLT